MRYPLRLRFQDHFSIFFGYYSAALILLLLLGFGLAWDYNRRQSLQRIATWPEVTANIKSAQINQINTTNDSGPGWSISVAMSLTYKVKDTPVITNFKRSFYRRSSSYYASTLTDGKQIQIRYNPKDPAEVSLYPHLF